RCLCSCLHRPRARPPLFPYTTLFRSDAASIGKLPVRAGNGELVELRNVARVEERAGPTQIDRQSLLRQITIYANLRQGVSLGEGDRKSTRLNSSHVKTSYAVVCLKNK